MRRLINPLLAASVVVASGCSTSGGPVPVGGFEQIVLQVPHLRQEPMLCVPTSASMVLAFYGDEHPPRQLKSFASGHPYDPAQACTDFTITHYDDILKALRKLGYEWAQHSFANDEAGFQGGLTLIETELRAGHPVLVDATLPTGHTFVIRGFDSSSKQLFVVDPDQFAPGIYPVSFDEFKTVWNEHAYGNDIRVMIVTQPSSDKKAV